LNVAFLFRAVARPDKGRVEVEGLQNMLGAMKLAVQNQQRRANLTGGGSSSSSPSNSPHAQVVLVSSAPHVLDDFETPFGSFKGIKRRGEEILRNDFPSLSHVIVQMGRYDDNFVQEGLDVQQETSGLNDAQAERNKEHARRRINRRDAARAAVEALVDTSMRNEIVQVWTATR
jgi:hypothetical protein